MHNYLIYEVDALIKYNTAKHFTFRIKQLNAKQENKKLITLIKNQDFEVTKLLTIEIKRG